MDRRHSPRDGVAPQVPFSDYSLRVFRRSSTFRGAFEPQAAGRTAGRRAFARAISSKVVFHRAFDVQGVRAERRAPRGLTSVFGAVLTDRRYTPALPSTQGVVRPHTLFRPVASFVPVKHSRAKAPTTFITSSAPPLNRSVSPIER